MGQPAGLSPCSRSAAYGLCAWEAWLAVAVGSPHMAHSLGLLAGLITPPSMPRYLSQRACAPVVYLGYMEARRQQSCSAVQLGTDVCAACQSCVTAVRRSCSQGQSPACWLLLTVGPLCVCCCTSACAAAAAAWGFSVVAVVSIGSLNLSLLLNPVGLYQVGSRRPGTQSIPCFCLLPADCTLGICQGTGPASC